MDWFIASLLLVLLGTVFGVIAWKLSADQFAAFLSGALLPILVCSVLFTLVLVVHIYQQPDWSSDILKVLAGVLIGSAVYGASTHITGDNNKVAGRDINELIERMETQVAQIEHASLSHPNAGPREYLVNTIYERPYDSLAQAWSRVVERWRAEGWEFDGASSDFGGMDGVILLFSRPPRNSGSSRGIVEAKPTQSVPIQFFHGSEMNPVRLDQTDAY